MRRRGFVTLLAAGVLGIAGPADALFHFAHISEVHTMLDGAASAQYVEIEMEFTAQNVVTDSVLHAWDCTGTSLGDLLVVPSNLVNAGTDVKWIMATTDPIGGITPDFVIPSADLPASCGQVCWGAPDDEFVPPDPGTWDHTDPTEYVDCLAYGGYTGPTKPESGTPTPLAPTATFALARATDTNDNAADFAHDCPTPENNDGEVGGPSGECTAPTTTTTIATTTTTLGGSTTTTTVPAGMIDQPLAGTKLVLKMKPGKPETSKLVLVAKDRTLSIGDGAGSAEDPTANGGSFRIASGSPGGAFTGSHALAGAWTLLGKPLAGKGYKWKSKTSPVRLVLVKTAKLLKVKAAGAAIGFDLDGDPDPVTVEVEIGTRRYCLEFGGDATFKDGRKYVAKKPAAPGACP